MPIPGPSGLAALNRTIKQTDVIIIHDALYCTSIAAMVFARWYRKPIILIQHIAAIDFSSAALRRAMRLANRLVTQPMMRMANQTVFISDTVKRSFADVRTARPPALLFNGVDSAVFHSGVAEPVSRALPGTGPVAVFVGRFVAKKGLAALQALATARPELTLVMAGSGPIDPRAWQLPNVDVVGPLDPEGVASLFHSSDLLLLPSVGEGYPLVIQEAMACGLPVVCGAESAAADPDALRWLRGVDVDLARPAETAAQMAEVVELPALSVADRIEMADYARRAYDWSRQASALASLARDLVRDAASR
jgi:glycosyltransferase involved in cell wall biosynthesis